MSVFPPKKRKGQTPCPSSTPKGSPPLSTPKERKNCPKHPLSAKKIAFLGGITAAALLAFLIENLFPPLIPAVPFVRVGVSNYFVLFAVAIYGKREGFFVMLAKLLLGALIAGRVASLLVGVAGAFSSYLLIALFFSRTEPRFSLAAIGGASAALGNAFRTAVAALLFGSRELLAFFSYAVWLGIGSGAIIGLSLHLSLRALPQDFLSRLQNL